MHEAQRRAAVEHIGDLGEGGRGVGNLWLKKIKIKFSKCYFSKETVPVSDQITDKVNFIFIEVHIPSNK